MGQPAPPAQGDRPGDPGGTKGAGARAQGCPVPGRMLASCGHWEPAATLSAAGPRSCAYVLLRPWSPPPSARASGQLHPAPPAPRSCGKTEEGRASVGAGVLAGPTAEEQGPVGLPGQTRRHVGGAHGPTGQCWVPEGHSTGCASREGVKGSPHPKPSPAPRRDKTPPAGLGPGDSRTMGLAQAGPLAGQLGIRDVLSQEGPARLTATCRGCLEPWPKGPQPQHINSSRA